IRMASAGRASPRKSGSTPAMMRRSDDLPAPFAPSTPILAPGKNARLMPRRISRFGGTTFRRSRMVTMYWGGLAVPVAHGAAPARPPCRCPSTRDAGDPRGVRPADRLTPNDVAAQRAPRSAVPAAMKQPRPRVAVAVGPRAHRDADDRAKARAKPIEL